MWRSVADLDNDGHIDIWRNDSWKNKDELVLLNNGRGEFFL